MPKRSPPARSTHDPFDPLDGRAVVTLDLHGFTADQAKSAVRDFLARARRQHPGQLVHIITGKGRNSARGPVLKPAVLALLKSAPRSDVAAWGRDDDEGGFLVRLGGGRF